MGIIFSEAAMIAGPAGIIGYLVGTGATYLAVHLVTGLQHVTMTLDPVLFGAAIVLAMVVGLLASVYFSAGDADRGFAQLDRAFEERSRDMIFLRVNQMLRGYRDDPRYVSLLERVGHL